MGIGVGVGCLLAGKLSGATVEYGLLPFGALGLTVTTLAFALIGPDLLGTIVVLAPAGPLQRILDRPAQRDHSVAISARPPRRNPRRLECLGLRRHVDRFGGGACTGTNAASTPEGLSAELRSFSAAAFSGRSRSSPQAFLRFLMVGLAHTHLSRARRGPVERTRPGRRPLIPNHVTFADGLFIITTIDRPVRFMVYHEYFDKPFIGWVLRSMKAIPIAASGGPKMILHAFREAGKEAK